MKKLTTQEFITKSKIVHKDKYSYEESKYLGGKEKIAITCKTHGLFYQIAADHMHGNGCSKCYGNNLSNSESFIKKANIIHNYKYNYVKAHYINENSKVVITCLTHGDFCQSPHSHLSNTGCMKCTNKEKLTIAKFIERAVIVHKYKYNYDLVNYKNTYHKVIIICSVHGKFNQTPKAHLNGHGCSKCAIGFGERYCRYSFEKIFNEKFINCNPDFLKYKRNLQLDGYCKELNIAFEYQGPQHYEIVKKYNSNQDILNAQIERDEFKRNKCKELTIKLIEIPYFNSNFKYEKLKEFIKAKAISLGINLPNNFDEIKMDYRDVI